MMQENAVKIEASKLAVFGTVEAETIPHYGASLGLTCWLSSYPNRTDMVMRATRVAVFHENKRTVGTDKLWYRRALLKTATSGPVPSKFRNVASACQQRRMALYKS